MSRSYFRGRSCALFSAILVALLASACADVTSPRDIAGVFVLERTLGSGVPVVRVVPANQALSYEYTGTGTYTVFADTIRLRSDDSAEWTRVWQSFVPGVRDSSVQTRRSELTYTTEWWGFEFIPPSINDPDIDYLIIYHRARFVEGGFILETRTDWERYPLAKYRRVE